MTDFTTPTNSSSAPKSDRNVIVSKRAPMALGGYRRGSGGRLAGVAEAGLQVGVDVVFADAERLADAGRPQVARLDQAVDRHRRDPKLVGDLVGRQEGRTRW